MKPLCKLTALIPDPLNSLLPSTEDLWDCLEQASGKPIAAVMSSWTKQMGFPIIVVDQEQVSLIDHKVECFKSDIFVH